MYKIYINEKPLVLISDDKINDFNNKANILLAKYPGKPKFLLNYIDMMEKGTKFEEVVLYDKDAKNIFVDLKVIAKPVKAAGGIVFNNKGEILVIFRKGFWDLAKGHIHKNEKKRDAAVREVMEETGIKKIEIGGKAGKTFHIYKEKSRYLKISYWYYMKANQLKLTPQTEEDILEAKWVNPKEFIDFYDMYASIKDLLLKTITV
jgi:8-oxo-dGTP pyrophosphatase MutT (NUDIX family)